MADPNPAPERGRIRKAKNFDLVDPVHMPWELADLAKAVIELAAMEEANGLRNRSGEALCKRFCDTYRPGHARLLSTLYNQTRWSLRMQDNDRRDAGMEPILPPKVTGGGP